MASKYNLYCKALMCGLADAMFKVGRDIPTVKSITGLTLAQMRVWGMIYEIVIPDPNGYSGGHPKTGVGAVHNGHMLHTGKWTPTCGVPDRTPRGKSNKQLKREDRKAFSITAGGGKNMPMDKKIFAQLQNEMEDIVHQIDDILPPEMKQRYCFTFVARDYTGDHANDIVLTNDAPQDAVKAILRQEGGMVESN